MVYCGLKERISKPAVDRNGHNAEDKNALLFKLINFSLQFLRKAAVGHPQHDGHHGRLLAKLVL